MLQYLPNPPDLDVWSVSRKLNALAFYPRPLYGMAVMRPSASYRHPVEWPNSPRSFLAIRIWSSGWLMTHFHR